MRLSSCRSGYRGQRSRANDRSTSFSPRRAPLPGSLVAALLLALPACVGSSRSGPAGAGADWLDRGEPFRADDAEMLDKTRFAWVREAQIDAAVRRLAAGQFHEISPEEAVSLAHGELPAAPGLRAFVVRGVSLGEAPTFAAVRYSKSLGALQVHQATAHPELYFPGAFTPPPASKRPLIVLLPAAPATVICTVALGGDRVFRGFGGPGMKRFPQPDAR